MARTKLPPRPKKALTLPAMMPSHASTVFMPFSRGGSKPNCLASLSSGTSSGLSAMPTVRWPWTLEWPRTGEIPVPSRPMLPFSSSMLTNIVTFSKAMDVLGQAHAVNADDAFGLDIDLRRRLR